VATPTYTPLQTITLGSSASSVTFSNIPTSSGYRDLVVVIAGTHTNGDTVGIRFNADSGNNYSSVSMQGNGSSASSSSWSSVSSGYYGVLYSSQGNAIIQVMDYSATDKHKTFLSRSNNAGNLLRAHAGRWANTAAVTSVTLVSFGAESYASGTTLSLYGIAA
jgi:hypothetical protein